MRNYLNLAPKYLKGQSKRAIFTALGIVLAVALIVSVGSIAESIKETILQQAIELNGTYHAQFKQIDNQSANVLQNHRSLAKSGQMMSLGSFKSDTKSFDMNIEYWDEVTAKEIFNLQLKSGRFPNDAGEIVLEQWALEQLNLDQTLGQVITLPFKQTFVEEGEWQEFQAEAEFKVVGIIDNISGAKATGRSLSLVDKKSIEQLLPQDMWHHYVFVVVHDGLPIRDTLYDIREALQLTGDDIHYNEMLLSALGEREQANWPIIFLAAIVIITVVATIYNIFHISILERMQQFGMLRSIGATPAQIRRIVMAEVLILSLIAVPLGLGVGVALSYFLGSSVTLLQQHVRDVLIPWEVLLFGGGLGIFASLAAVLLPARAASKVSPLQAIRTHNKVLKKSKTSSRGALLNKFLGITGKMAYQNLWRNKLRTLVTIFSLSLGVILFVIFSFWVSSADTSNLLQNYIHADYSLKTDARIGYEGYTDDLLEDIRDMEGIERVVGTHMRFSYLRMGAEEMNEEAAEEFLRGPFKASLEEDTGLYLIGTDIYGYDSEILQENILLEEGTLDIERMANEPVALVTSYDNPGLNVGDIMSIQLNILNPDNSRTIKDVEVEIVGFIERVPISMNWKSPGPRVVLHSNVWRDIAETDVYKRVEISATPGANTEQIERALKQYAASAPRGAMISYAEEQALIEQQIQDIAMLMYSLIAVIAFIALLSVINTITTNLIIRIREFGTLRALGMTNDQLGRMVRLEGLLYGFSGAFGGTIIGSILAYVLFLLLSQEMTYLVWSYPWFAVVFAWIASITLGVLATVVPLRRITKMNIIESVRRVE